MMIQERQVFINAVMSVIQVVVLGVILFVLYRYVIVTLGVQQLGIWSLVLATTAVTRISDLGLSASVVKFVAKYIARNQDESVAGVIQTAAISIGVLIALTLLIAYPFASWLLTLILQEAALEFALSVLPYALLSLWITAITGVFLAGLDGYQRMDLRSMLLIGGGVFHLLLCFALVPSYRLMGLAYAQITQAGMVMIGSWFLLRRQLQILPPIPYRWSRDLFGEMVSYGSNFQVASIAKMLHEPIIKGLLAKFGDLATVGYFEMASRLTTQLRALLVSANRALVPTIANLQEKEPEVVQVVYRDSYRLLFYLSLPFYAIIIVCVPIISEIWIGRFESEFILFATLLSVGWFLNTLCAPAYFANLGLGDLRWNTIGHITIGLLNGGLGLLLGKVYGAIGVVFGWMFSLVIGTGIITVSYHIRHKIPLRELLPEQNNKLGMASGIGVVIGLVVYYGLRDIWSFSIVSNLSVIAFASVVACPVWFHPLRKRLIGLFGDHIFRILKVGRVGG